MLEADPDTKLKHSGHASRGPFCPRVDVLRLSTVSEAVFTLVTRGRFFDVGVRIYIEPNGTIFDVSPKNDRASPIV